ncbi:hypothetical protein PF002_g9054 [Phytophthora fragariae]|uniref:Elicitin n=1 Tax=Phytophthora fragariae TaxID=53985 RepID=A0A6A4E6C3_9STRA|nr:hypothetical protein PF003_g25653 [Phytophthora fragariae]KAE9123280.1 hypothetical protein PF007_g7123 [Phytophthora fragariae]KAE9148265.1 hypothetical protein PF006_g7137 [Phytophthora fragariae]KAE9241858.1 hypothetical protein PF002_g9054 [Phytophthora fragariae]KAE9318132.1 hypothetical protein PF001_g6521 [Phytophthora fragariae]
MKTSALFLSVAAIALKIALVQSAECTTDELTTIASIYSSATSKGTAACPDLTSTTDVTASDYCTNSDCLQFMSDMLDGFPDCSSSGVNLKQGLQSAVDYCTSGTTDMDESGGQAEQRWHAGWHRPIYSDGKLTQCLQAAEALKGEPINLLINNAGKGGGIPDVTKADIMKFLEVNAVSPFQIYIG